MSDKYTIISAESHEDLVLVRSLFTAYVRWLDLDLSFQDYQTEFDNLPGKYAPPTGRLLLATDIHTKHALGCVAIRALPESDSDICEMKRLFVLPAGRGLGLGKALVKAAIREAVGMGYRTMKLDTLEDRMSEAVVLYEKLGFVQCSQYYPTTLLNTKFYELDLHLHLDSSVT